MSSTARLHRRDRRSRGRPRVDPGQGRARHGRHARRSPRPSSARQASARDQPRPQRRHLPRLVGHRRARRVGPRGRRGGQPPRDRPPLRHRHARARRSPGWPSRRRPSTSCPGTGERVTVADEPTLRLELSPDPRLLRDPAPRRERRGVARRVRPGRGRGGPGGRRRARRHADRRQHRRADRAHLRAGRRHPLRRGPHRPRHGRGARGRSAHRPHPRRGGHAPRVEHRRRRRPRPRSRRRPSAAAVPS